MQKIEVQKLTYSIAEAAAVLGISRSRMYDLARSEGFPSFMVGKRTLISREGLGNWVEAQSKMS